MSLDTLIADTRQAIADDAANAHAVFTAQGTLVGVTEVDVSTGAHTFKVDEPPALGGADAAANPVQYALASLGSCQAITYRFWAAQLGVELDSITVRVEGDLDLRGFFGVDDAVRPGFTVGPGRGEPGRTGERGTLRRTGRGRGRALSGARPVHEPRTGVPRARHLGLGRLVASMSDQLTAPAIGLPEFLTCPVELLTSLRQSTRLGLWK